jgi:LysM repeat protein
MQDYGKRLLIVMIIAICIGLLFVGGSTGQADEIETLPKDWIWPSNGEISDTFGTRNGSHKGIDIAAPLNTDIVAAADGIVTKSYYSHTYGNVVFISHGSFEAVYAHLNERLTEVGQQVKQGQIIGKMGNTGRSRGVHLHFEIHKDEWTFGKENAMDPLLVLEQSRLVSVSNEANVNIEKALDVTVPVKEDMVYTVEKGDTLWSISVKFDTEVERIMHLNNLNSDLIYPNQRLVIHKGYSITKLMKTDILWPN